jgi:hypothetical protein
MSEERCIDFMNRVTKIFNQEPGLSPRDKALILASLAQVEATLEVADQLKAGIKLQAGVLPDTLEIFQAGATLLARELEKFSAPAEHLAGQMDRFSASADYLARRLPDY